MQISNSKPDNFHPAIVDSLPQLTTVIDSNGAIQCTNMAWREFGKTRGYTLTEHWLDVNYLDVCDASTNAGNNYSDQAAQGIRQIISGKRADFRLDYPCLAPEQEQWFRMHVHPMQHLSQQLYLIVHQDITETVNYINHLEKLAVTDELTGIGNRRSFNIALDTEWRRDTRSGSPLSLIRLDIDEFKLFNDQFGHPAGDDVLKKVASVLQGYSRRPGDCAARCEGEKFALVLGNTGPDSAIKIGRSLLQAIRALEIEHTPPANSNLISVSLGIATTYPLQGLSVETITATVDRKMYRAKRNGGDGLVV